MAWVSPSIARHRKEENTHQVVCGDAIAWLKEQADESLPSIFCSLPDAAELSGDLRYNLDKYRQWFKDTARLMFTKMHPKAFMGAFATDRNWRATKTRVSKFAMYFAAAEDAGWDLAWHKIVPADPPQPGRPTFSHFMLFVKDADGTVGGEDIVPAGDKTWPNATPLGPVHFFLKLLCEAQVKRGVPTGVVDLFAGIGTVAVEAHRRRPAFQGKITAVELDPDRCATIEAALTF